MRIPSPCLGRTALDALFEKRHLETCYNYFFACLGVGNNLRPNYAKPFQRKKVNEKIWKVSRWQSQWYRCVRLTFSNARKGHHEDDINSLCHSEQEEATPLISTRWSLRENELVTRPTEVPREMERARFFAFWTVFLVTFCQATLFVVATHFPKWLCWRLRPTKPCSRQEYRLWEGTYFSNANTIPRGLQVKRKRRTSIVFLCPISSRKEERMSYMWILAEIKSPTERSSHSS